MNPIRYKAKKEYEKTLVSFIERYKSKKGSDILNNINKTIKTSFENLLSSKFFYDTHRFLGLNVAPGVVPEKVLTVSDNRYILDTIDNIVLNDCFYDFVINFVKNRQQDIDCIIELGSGAGTNLIRIADRLSLEQRQKIKFYACEFTSAGQKASSFMNDVYEKIGLSTHYFNYHEPKLDFLDNKKNNLFITRHSIEQIPILNKELFYEMKRSSNKYSCINCEPVGWQDNEDLITQRLCHEKSFLLKIKEEIKSFFYKIDSYLYKKIKLSILDSRGRFGIKIDKNDLKESNTDNYKVSFIAAIHSLKNGYNMNLIPILKELEQKEKIQIETKKINACGGNPLNPSTIIAWKIIK